MVAIWWQYGGNMVAIWWQYGGNMVAIRWQYFHIFYVICYFEHLKYLITFNAKSYKFFCRGLRPPAPTPLLQVSLRAPLPHHSFISSLTPLPSLSNSCSGSAPLQDGFSYFFCFIIYLSSFYRIVISILWLSITSLLLQTSVNLLCFQRHIPKTETHTQNRDIYPKQRHIPKTESYTQSIDIKMIN